MLKKMRLFLLIFILSACFLNGIIHAEEWSRTFGGGLTDTGTSVQQTDDGGYIIAGNTQSYGSGDYDVYLIKTDNEGNEIWSRTFGGTKLDTAFEVQQTRDGGYIIAGMTKSFTSDNDEQVYLIKTNENGVLEWSKVYGGSLNDAGCSVKETNDNGFIIAGYSYLDAYTSDVYLIKTNENGVRQWERTFGGMTYDTAWSVEITNDGGYIIAGTSDSYGSREQIYIIKTNGFGVEEWHKTYGGSKNERGSEIKKTRDGGYIISGTTYSYTGGDDYLKQGDFYLIKIDEEGNEQWSNYYGEIGHADYGRSVKQTPDNGYIITGEILQETWNTYLVKTDENGNEMWNKTFGGTKVDRGFCVNTTSDFGYVITGTTDSDLHLIYYSDSNLAEFKMSEYSFENTLVDNSGNGYDGRFIGKESYSNGVKGKAIDLNGSNYVKIDDYSDFSDMEEFTLYAWIKPRLLGRYNSIISKVNPSRDFNLCIYQNTITGAHFAHGSKYYNVLGNKAPLGKWSQIAATWDGTYFKMYFNGNLVSETKPNSTPPHSGRKLLIGSMNDYERFNGKIDEVKIYSKALDSNEIKSLYNIDAENLMLHDVNLIPILPGTAILTKKTGDSIPYRITESINFNASIGGNSNPNLNRIRLKFDVSRISEAKEVRLKFSSSYLQSDGDIAVYPSTCEEPLTASNAFNNYDENNPLHMETIRNGNEKIIILNSEAIDLINQNDNFSILLLADPETSYNARMDSKTVQLMISQ